MSIGIGVVYILHQCCIGMNHIVRVGGSVFVSLILEWNSSFDVSHCQNPEASVENRKQKESGLRKEMLVSMAMWSMCLCVWWPHACMSLSPSLFFCLSVCLLAAHGAVTCQAPVYMNTLCSKRDKSTGESHQRKFTIHCSLTCWNFRILTTCSSDFLLSLNTPHAGHGRFYLRSLSADIEVC